MLVIGQYDIEFEGFLIFVLLEIDRYGILIDIDILADHLEQFPLQLGQIRGLIAGLAFMRNQNL